MTLLGRFGTTGIKRSLHFALTLLLGVTMTTLAGARAATAQEPGGRFRVLVVPVKSDVLDDDFGEDVAEELRDRLDEFETHAAVPEKEYERALKRYEVDKDQLNAIKARQLANLIGAQVVFVGELQKAGRAYELKASFVDVKTGDEVPVPAVTVEDDSDEAVNAVVDAVIAAFERQVKFVRARAFCADYVGSQQPDNALRNCNDALEINPNSVPVLFNKGLAFRQLFENQSGGTDGWADSAVAYFEKVLAERPGHRNALQNAAYIHSRLGNAEEASRLYENYLELDPENVPIRLKVAYDLMNADLAPEAIEILEEGLPYDSTNVDLLQTLGDYKLRAAQEDSTYIFGAVEAYEKVLELKGGETDLAIIENVMAAYTKANRTQEAIEFGNKALKAHGDSPRLWSLYADALGRAERYQDAAAAMDSVVQLDPSYQHGYLKRGRFKLQAGLTDAAMADLQKAIDEGSSNQTDVYNLLWGEAHGARSAGQLGKAGQYFEYASRFVPDGEKQKLEFWWGYTYFQRGDQIAKMEEPSLNQLRAAQNYFQAAQEHFQRAGSVRKELAQLKDATQKWLHNVDARIRRLQRS